MRDRAWRRSQMQVRKQRIVRMLKANRWSDQIDNPRHIGFLARTPHPCSCDMCGHQRKWYGPKISELRRVPLDIEDELEYIEEDEV